MSRRPVGTVPTPAQNRSRLAAMAEVASAFKSFRPAAEVVRRVEGVPTIFPDLDRAFGCGGLPTGRIHVVHGPPNNGKTALTLGLGLSFLRRDHFFGLADLERTTPVEWLQNLYGAANQHPGFVALSGDGTFEHVRAAHREFFEGVAEGRATGKLDPDTRALTLVDSIKKLMPKKLWEELEKAMAADTKEAKVLAGGRKHKPKGGIDGAGGRAGQIKAQFLSAWFDELVPLLHDTQGTILMIARENVEEETVGQFTREIITLGGGNAPNFEASLTLRVLGTGLYDEHEKERRYVGEKHIVQIRKTKVAAKEERLPEAVFHTSNGSASPAGFDHARDLLACALELGVVEIAGSHYKWSRGRLGQGIEGALAALRRHEADARDLEAECRAKMRAASVPV